MPTVTNELFIAAPPDVVYRTAKDVETFPEFMPDVKSVRTVESSDDGRRTVTEWVGLVREFAVTVKWTEEDLWDDDARRCDFRLVKGDYKSYGGSWEFLPQEGGTLFRSVVDYEYELPLVGPLIKGLVRKKMQENVTRLQEAIRDRVEEMGK
jgi:ribosome-associated toxin RatA of RatAB toxin-antitoxin module